ncbi:MULTISPECIES: threonine/serine exporter ThrE family protein [unclassified Rathayibacter]|uniref:threonine/serine ThrE exporter family protein n=1 Tax=unclassified Rathayibacter TaxID=2609250 RepID=UPI001052839F|nr:MULTISPECIES: threonine/serine exporter family protein [unclassified Rathayibacter]MCJ1674705.1 threonine/serine exporter family protein [Rathayibacter sp. VKM Ac-2929]MCJ1682835.1 threonine/serine exporter family protein [Rathayibacter sp. VKM Ac-2928]
MPSPRPFQQRLLRQLVGTLSGQRPAAPVSRRSQRAVLAEQTVRGVLELAVRLGETLLSLGSAAAEVTETIERVCRAYGIEVQVDLTFTSILVVHDGSEDSPSVSVLRVVASRSADYERLARVTTLVTAITDGSPEVRVADTVDSSTARDQARQQFEDAHERLDAILVQPHRYRRSVVTLTLAVMAAGVAILLGGGPLIVLLAALTTAAIDGVNQLLGRWGLPAFFQQIAGAALATGVAVLLLAVVPQLPVEFAVLPPALVVASGVVVLLAGLSFVGAADDAINGFPITAGGRLLEVGLLTLGIVVGIAAVLDGARTLGVELVLVDSYARPWPASVQVLGAGIAAGAWALSSHTPPRPALVAALTGAGAWVASDALSGLGAAPLLASAVPAIVIGLLGETLAERWRVPAVVTTACGIVPLLPGLTLYRGVLDLTSGRGPEGGIELLLQAGMIAIGLAGGVTLGRIAYRRLRTPVVRAVAPVRARRSPHPESAPTAEEPLARTGTMPIISTIGVTEPTEDDLAGGAAAAKD